VHRLGEIAIIEREPNFALHCLAIDDGPDRRELQAETLVIVEAGTFLIRNSP
jgi:hypothetical protein